MGCRGIYVLGLGFGDMGSGSWAEGVAFQSSDSIMWGLGLG